MSRDGLQPGGSKIRPSTEAAALYRQPRERRRWSAVDQVTELVGRVGTAASLQILYRHHKGSSDTARHVRTPETWPALSMGCSLLAHHQYRGGSQIRSSGCTSEAAESEGVLISKF